MSIPFLLRASTSCFALLAVPVLLISCTPGPPGPAGPPGPSGSGGGPPYVWICTPTHYPNVGNTSRADVYVFNGSSTTANVAVNILDRDGNNLAGVTVPGSSPAQNYPGETGSSTVPLPAAHTRNVTFVTPQTGGGAGFDGVTHVAITVRVVSDQPIAVGTNFQFGGFNPVPCSLLPK